MKILLANPATRIPIDEKRERFFIKAGSRWPWSIIKKKDEKNTNIFFPFFLAYTAGILKESGYGVYVLDGVAMDLQEEDFLGKARTINPDVVIIETQTHAFNHDIALCEKIKALLPNIKIILTGAHVTVFPKEILEKTSSIDFIALGEYEFTVKEVIDRINSGVRDFKIKGLGYKEGNNIWVSGEKGFIEDINTLPFPAFNLFPCNEQPDLSIYRDGICTYSPAVTLHSSRGCPFKCNFCLWNQVMYGNGPYRMFSPERVADEMEYVIKNYGAKEIYFDDDDFTVNKKHVLGICEKIKERKLDVKWSCMGDAMCADEEMIKAMADSGCIFMKFGVESGSKLILKNVGKPLDPDKAVKIAELCHKYGIWCHATFSFGLAGETRDTMRETLRLANRIQFDYAQVSITTPFPGTKYYDQLLEEGSLKTEEWDSFDGTMTCAFNSGELTAHEIENFRKQAIRSMILHKIVNPAWIKRFIKRNHLLLKNYGIHSVLNPIKTLLNL